jgi:Macro domain
MQVALSRLHGCFAAKAPLRMTRVVGLADYRRDMRLHLEGGKIIEIAGPADITHETTDAIVNAANSSLLGGGGVDGAIHRAGGPAILEDCRKIVSRIGRLAAGNAVITTSGNLRVKHVIHTVGPVFRDGNHRESETLASCYRWRTNTSLPRSPFPRFQPGRTDIL